MMIARSILRGKVRYIKCGQPIRCKYVNGMLSVSHLVQNILKYRNGLPTKQQRTSTELEPTRIVYSATNIDLSSQAELRLLY